MSWRSFRFALRLRLSYKYISPKFPRARFRSLNTIQLCVNWPTSFDQRSPSTIFVVSTLRNAFRYGNISHYNNANEEIRCLSRLLREVWRHDFSLNPSPFLPLFGPHIGQSGAFRKVWPKCGAARYSWRNHSWAPSWVPSSRLAAWLTNLERQQSRVPKGRRPPPILRYPGKWASLEFALGLEVIARARR